jgi:HTH-type transcriptional regulator / antitoxin HigA
MSELKYKVISDDEQYYEYCDILEELVFSDEPEKRQDEIDLLTLLIETWDKNNNGIPELDPVELIKSLMEDHDLKQTDLVEIAGVGKSTISEILNYKKRMSKNVIRNLANHFKIQQEALNKPYRLEGEGLTNDYESKFSQTVEAKFGNTVSYEEPVQGFNVEGTSNMKIYKSEAA